MAADRVPRKKKLSSDLSDDEINILSNGSISADSFFYKSIGFNANRLEWLSRI